jgi:hypothetical protein
MIHERCCCNRRVDLSNAQCSMLNVQLNIEN